MKKAQDDIPLEPGVSRGRLVITCAGKTTEMDATIMVAEDGSYWAETDNGITVRSDGIVKSATFPPGSMD